MPYKLVWTDGLGNFVKAIYDTEEEVLTQARYEAGRAGGPELKHVLNSDGVVIAAWDAMGNSGKQRELTGEDLASYAEAVASAQIPAEP